MHASDATHPRFLSYSFSRSRSRRARRKCLFRYIFFFQMTEFRVPKREFRANRSTCNNRACIYLRYFTRRWSRSCRRSFHGWRVSRRATCDKENSSAKYIGSATQLNIKLPEYSRPSSIIPNGLHYNGVILLGNCNWSSRATFDGVEHACVAWRSLNVRARNGKTNDYLR